MCLRFSKGAVMMTGFRTVTPNFSAAPQISLDDVAVAAQSAFKAIICNRPDGEDGGQIPAADIAAACAQHGLAFTHIPVSGGMNQIQVDQMATALDQAGGAVLAYCRSGTRSTNLWALAQATTGEDAEALVEAASGAGYDLGGLLPSLRALAQRA
jgi:uncharacterized protein (TIGR01244 family)